MCHHLPISKDLIATPKSENLTQVAGGSCITARVHPAKAAPAAPPQSGHSVCESRYRTGSDGGVPGGAVTSDLKRVVTTFNLEQTAKVALSTDLRDDPAATLWPPHHFPRATRAALCRRAQSWGPSTGRRGFPSQVPSALGFGHQTHTVYTGRECSSSAREGTGQRTQIRCPRLADSSGSALG